MTPPPCRVSSKDKSLWKFKVFHSWRRADELANREPMENRYIDSMTLALNFINSNELEDFKIFDYGYCRVAIFYKEKPTLTTGQLDI